MRNEKNYAVFIHFGDNDFSHELQVFGNFVYHCLDLSKVTKEQIVTAFNTIAPTLVKARYDIVGGCTKDHIDYLVNSYMKISPKQVSLRDEVYKDPRVLSGWDNLEGVIIDLAGVHLI